VVVTSADGSGTLEAKIGIITIFDKQQLIQYPGKLFYRWDQPFMSPSEVLKMDPAPLMVMYQQRNLERISERNPMEYHLAQVNIARMQAPLTDPIMAGFVAELDNINALADHSPGFVWRLQTDEGNATDIRPFDDDLILVNLSLWASLADLTNFVYKSRHRQVLQQRQQWFQRFNGPYVALWWVPSGHIPTVDEAKERLSYLSAHGETPYAFSFKKPFPTPESASDLIAPTLKE